MSRTNITICKYNTMLNDVLGLQLPALDIVRSKGLLAHMIKRNHFSALKHIDDLADIITQPDYVGINPNEKGVSFELVKCLKTNVLIGIKLNQDETGEYLYVATMHQISQLDIEKKLAIHRLKKVLDKPLEDVYNDNANENNVDEPEQAPGAPDEGT